MLLSVWCRNIYTLYVIYFNSGCKIFGTEDVYIVLEEDGTEIEDNAALVVCKDKTLQVLSKHQLHQTLNSIYYLCLFAYSGFKHILCCVFGFVCLRLVYPLLPVHLDCPFLIALRYSLKLIYDKFLVHQTIYCINYNKYNKMVIIFYI
jgi:hypothetical protein